MKLFNVQFRTSHEGRDSLVVNVRDPSSKGEEELPAILRSSIGKRVRYQSETIVAAVAVAGLFIFVGAIISSPALILLGAIIAVPSALLLYFLTREGFMWTAIKLSPGVLWDAMTRARSLQATGDLNDVESRAIVKLLWSADRSKTLLNTNKSLLNALTDILDRAEYRREERQDEVVKTALADSGWSNSEFDPDGDSLPGFDEFVDNPDGSPQSPAQ